MRCNGLSLDIYTPSWLYAVLLVCVCMHCCFHIHCCEEKPSNNLFDLLFIYTTAILLLSIDFSRSLSCMPLQFCYRALITLIYAVAIFPLRRHHRRSVRIYTRYGIHRSGTCVLREHRHASFSQFPRHAYEQQEHRNAGCYVWSLHALEWSRLHPAGDVRAWLHGLVRRCWRCQWRPCSRFVCFIPSYLH